MRSIIHPQRLPRESPAMSRSWSFKSLATIAAAEIVSIVMIAVTATVAPGAEEPTTDPSAKRYVDANEQLVVEIYVRNIKDSTEFYERLGFKVLRKEPKFVELGWEGSRLFLDQAAGQPAPPTTVVANIRVMVPDVDRSWKVCLEMHLPVKHAIGDRYYGLRDFTVVSPDGIGLRFASYLKKKVAK
jgi:catechol 2,3-dioxygenase-like lactoylglutathione lyase family enzyme